MAVTRRSGERDAALRLDVLREPLAIVRLPAGSVVPSWTSHARQFLSITRTPTELSIVADAGAVPDAIDAPGRYRAFRVKGPMPLDLVGVMARIATPLAEASVAIFPIATHDTDYVLIAERDVARARDALERAGHRVVEND